MADSPDDRIAVSASAHTLGVSIQIGDTLVALTLPATKSVRDQNETAIRATALRLASRALEVAQEEVRQAQAWAGKVEGAR